MHRTRKQTENPGFRRSVSTNNRKVLTGFQAFGEPRQPCVATWYPLKRSKPNKAPRKLLANYENRSELMRTLETREKHLESARTPSKILVKQSKTPVNIEVPRGVRHFKYKNFFYTNCERIQCSYMYFLQEERDQGAKGHQICLIGICVSSTFLATTEKLFNFI
jgi:hypothetical protein